MFARATARRAPRLPLNARSVSTTATSNGFLTARRVATASITLVSGTLLAAYYLDSRSAIHRYVVTPVMRHTLDAETAHKLAVKLLRTGWGPRDRGTDEACLETELWGEKLSNPVGLAAGFDKNGEAVDGLFDLGFAWVEIGSITPKPQPGNPTPRVFHLLADNAMINRYGFPSDGAVSVLSRLRARLPSYPSSLVSSDSTSTSESTHASLRSRALLAINLGKNKSSPPDSISDFLSGVRTFGAYADVLVVNVSSPNTPGLRGLQSRGMLEELLAGITSARDDLVSTSISTTVTGGRPPRIVLKVAPDLSEEELRDVAEAVRSTPGVDGVIVSNTTIQRPNSLIDDTKVETGGLSGPPLLPLSLHALRTLRTHLPASIPLIGCGGISSGADALAFARAGASAVQLYTAFGYDGVGACRRIKDELTEELKREGTTWNEVVGKAVRELSAKDEEASKKPERKLAASKPVAAKAKSVYQDLIDEALQLRDNLDDLSRRMST